MNRVSFPVLLVSLFFGAAISARADCHVGGGLFADKSISTSWVTLPNNLVVESRSYSPGEVIFSSGWVAGSNNQLTIAGCSRQYTVGYFYMNAPQNAASAGTTIMPTTITGLGVRVSAMNQAGPYDSPMIIDNDWHSGDGSNNDHTLRNSSYMVELVALGGTISSGELDFGQPVAQVDFRESESHGASGDIASEIRLTTSNVVVKAMGCQADVSAIHFPFGKVNLSAFEGGNTAGSAPAQDVNLSCEPGTNVSLEVNAAEASGNNANHTVIALTNAGTEGVASGVGVQLGLKSSHYDSGTNGLPLNQTIALLTSTRSGQSYTSGGAMGSEKLTFSAVYYKTGTQVLPGTANAAATLTLSYN